LVVEFGPGVGHRAEVERDGVECIAFWANNSARIAVS